MSFDFLGKGLRFPFRFDRRTGGVEISTVDAEHARIHQSIRQILGTRLGERLMNPEFGSKLPDLVFESNDKVLKGLIRHHVADALKRWEKRIVVTQVSFGDNATNKDRNILLVHIGYRLIRSQVEGNFVYPFYREVRG